MMKTNWDMINHSMVAHFDKYVFPLLSSFSDAGARKTQSELFTTTPGASALTGSSFDTNNVGIAHYDYSFKTYHYQMSHFCLNEDRLVGGSIFPLCTTP